MKEDPRSVPAVRDHLLLAVMALGVMALTLFQEGYAGWAMLPVVPGLLSLLVYSSAGPAFVLGMLSLVLMVGNRLRGFPPWHRPPGSDLTDFLLAVSALVYVAAHWRLRSLVRHAVPADPRRAARPAKRRLEGRWMLPAADAIRTPERVPAATELFTLVGQAVLFAAAGYLLGVRLTFESTPEAARVPDVGWRLLMVAWGVLVALMGGHVAFAAVRWYLAGRDECLLYLQDQLWSATRGEQRRIAAWVTKARLDRKE
ncbi:MAG: hypothetical protein ACRC33_22460 [Gemmataceae bacterium]